MLSIDCEEDENDDKKSATNTPRLSAQSNQICALRQKLLDGIEKLKVTNQDIQSTPRKNPRLNKRHRNSSAKKSANKKRKRRRDMFDSSNTETDDGNSDTDEDL
jgi:hypothetical protein